MKITKKDREIFKYLLKLAKTSNDPEGVVAAALVDGDYNIVISHPCASDGIRHAEDLVLEEAEKEGLVTSKLSLYTTLEPCCRRSKNVCDCTTLIIDQGVDRVIIGARDPEWSQETKERLEKAGIRYLLIGDEEIKRQCIDTFNSTIKVDLNKMQLPRKKKL